MSPKTATAQARARARTGDRPAAPFGAEGHSAVEATVIADLVRAQRRLAVGVLLVMTFGLGALPALLALRPSLSTFDIVGLPFPWLVLGLLTFPVLVAVAVVYARAAERIEREFTELVEQA